MPMPILKLGRDLLALLVVSAPDATVIPSEGLHNALLGKRIIYVGEQHDQAVHHETQRRILEMMTAERAWGNRDDLVLGLEMLDVTQQSPLDDWLAGRMSDADFETFWRKAWGYPFSLYKSLLDHAKATGIPVRALNAPIAVVRQVAKGGLSSLTPEQRALLPKTIHPITDARYLAYVRKALSEHGPMPPAVEARMLEAMAVWNETMAESAIDAAGTERRVVVAAGMGHMFYQAGIAESVRRRAPLEQTVALPYPLDGAGKPMWELLQDLKKPDGDIQLADYFLLNPSPPPVHGRGPGGEPQSSNNSLSRLISLSVSGKNLSP